MKLVFVRKGLDYIPVNINIDSSKRAEKLIKMYSVLIWTSIHKVWSCSDFVAFELRCLFIYL